MSIIHGAATGRFDGDEFSPGVSSPREYNYEDHVWRVYRMTARQLGDMRRAQGGRCAICQEERPLVVDHDHETGDVRGLLCRRCNVTLGYARDEPELLELMAEYLRRSQTTGL